MAHDEVEADQLASPHLDGPHREWDYNTPKLDAGALGPTNLWGSHGLGPRCRKLEATRRQGQGEVGSLLTDDDLTTIQGSRELLVGKIQERYGIAKDEARKQIDEYFTSQGY